MALIAAPLMLMRPRTSAPSMVKNRRLAEAMVLEYVPSGATWAYRSSRASRGTRTWSKVSRPLSTPPRPALRPQSVMVTPGAGRPSSSRIGTRRAWTPWSSPSVTSWAKTTAIRPSRAALPM